MPIRVLRETILARALFAFALFSSFTNTLIAQIDTGAIVGTVRDSGGGAIPKAAVTVTNAATGLKQSTTTNDSGEYQFTALLPGNYSVMAMAPGFGAQSHNDIEIHVQS